MIIKISQEGISKAKNTIKELKRNKKIWIKTKEQAESRLEKLPIKYLYNIKQTIKQANQKIFEYEKKIKDFNKVIETGEVDI